MAREVCRLGNGRRGREIVGAGAEDSTVRRQCRDHMVEMSPRADVNDHLETLHEQRRGVVGEFQCGECTLVLARKCLHDGSNVLPAEPVRCSDS